MRVLGLRRWRHSDTCICVISLRLHYVSKFQLRFPATDAPCNFTRMFSIICTSGLTVTDLRLRRQETIHTPYNSGSTAMPQEQAAVQTEQICCLHGTDSQMGAPWSSQALATRISDFDLDPMEFFSIQSTSERPQHYVIYSVLPLSRLPWGPFTHSDHPGNAGLPTEDRCSIEDSADYPALAVAAPVTPLRLRPGCKDDWSKTRYNSNTWKGIELKGALE